MADASVFVMEHVDFKDTYKAGAKDIRNCHINIGTGKEITIRELAGLIVNTVGYQGKLTFDSSKPDGTMRKLTDPSKLHNLGWHHKIDIEEGGTENVRVVSGIIIHHRGHRRIQSDKIERKTELLYPPCTL